MIYILKIYIKNEHGYYLAEKLVPGICLICRISNNLRAVRIFLCGQRIRINIRSTVYQSQTSVRSS
jgi:hypothetical protein